MDLAAWHIVLRVLVDHQAVQSRPIDHVEGSSNRALVHLGEDVGVHARQETAPRIALNVGENSLIHAGKFAVQHGHREVQRLGIQRQNCVRRDIGVLRYLRHEIVDDAVF